MCQLFLHLVKIFVSNNIRYLHALNSILLMISTQSVVSGFFTYIFAFQPVTKSPNFILFNDFIFLQLFYAIL